MNHLIKFPEGHEDGDEDKEFKKLWHLKAGGIGDREFTACGLAFTEYKIEEKEKQKGGVTCSECLETIKFYHQIKL